MGAAAALALGAYRVRHGEMSLEALLIVLMAGTEIFRPLRDLRTVLHQGLTGQARRRASCAARHAKHPPGASAAGTSALITPASPLGVPASRLRGNDDGARVTTTSALHSTR